MNLLCQRELMKIENPNPKIYKNAHFLHRKKMIVFKYFKIIHFSQFHIREKITRLISKIKCT